MGYASAKFTLSREENHSTLVKTLDDFEITRITEWGSDPRTCLDNLIDGFQSRDMLAMFVYKTIANYGSCFA